MGSTATLYVNGAYKGETNAQTGDVIATFNNSVATLNTTGDKFKLFQYVI